MRRRQLLRVGALAVPLGLAGCLGDALPGDSNEETPTQTPSPTPTPTTTGPPEGDSLVEVVDRDEQPNVPVEYTVSMAEPLATDEHPARVRVELSNTGEADLVLGERRSVQGYHGTSSDGALYLMPVGDGRTGDPVEAGCWKLTDYVAVTTEYGTVEVPAGESLTAESFVYGRVDSPGDCLSPGEHRVGLGGRVAESSAGVIGDEDATEFSWGFTLRVENG